jgi:tRNA threonylcarbamoyladenosine biosynthesis protein TsaE
MNQRQIALPQPEATFKLGYTLGEHLPAGSVLLLEGNLGAGKTTLIQGLGQGLGIQEPVVSPTFTLLNEYPEGRLPLYHFDLYRLEAAAATQLNPELYWEGVEVDPGIVAIEWAERLPYCPPAYLALRLEPDPAGGRILTATAHHCEDLLDRLTSSN